MGGAVDDDYQEYLAFNEPSPVTGSDDFVAFVTSNTLHPSSACQLSMCPISPSSSAPSLFTSKTSSFSSDVKFSEELHLNSLTTTGIPSISATTTEEDAQDEVYSANQSPDSLALGIPINEVSPCRQKVISHSQADRVAGRASGTLDESLPVLQIIQTGSMSFTNEEIAVLNIPGTPLSNCNSNKFGSFSMEKRGGEKREQNGEEHGVSNTILSSSQLLAQIPSIEFFAAPIAPLKIEVAVPFKWEEAPGKPKPCSDHAPYNSLPSLQLPPRLLYHSDMNPNSPVFRRSQSSKCGLIPSSWSSSPRAQGDLLRSGSTKNMWHRAAFLKKEEYPWSPSSTLFGPDSGKRGLSSSTSSASCSSVPDLPSVCSSRSSEALSAIGGDDSDVDQSESHLAGEESQPLNFSFSGFGPSNEESNRSHGLKKCATERMKSLLTVWRTGRKWRYARNERKKRFQEAEVWAPTLATYFHSMELERGCSGSGQLLLEGKNGGASAAPASALSSLPSEAVCGALSKSCSVGESRTVETKVMAVQMSEKRNSVGLDGTSPHCCSPSTSFATSTTTTTTTTTKTGGRKLRRSSRFFAAIWRSLSLCGKKRRSSSSRRKGRGRRICYVNLKPTWV